MQRASSLGQHLLLLLFPWNVLSTTEAIFSVVFPGFGGVVFQSIIVLIKLCVTDTQKAFVSKNIWPNIF